MSKLMLVELHVSLPGLLVCISAYSLGTKTQLTWALFIALDRESVLSMGCKWVVDSKLLAPTPGTRMPDPPALHAPARPSYAMERTKLAWSIVEEAIESDFDCTRSMGRGTGGGET